MTEEATLALKIGTLQKPRRGPAGRSYFEPERDSIERELEALLPDDAGNVVSRAIRHAVLGGAQRIRPILSLRIASLLGAESPAVLRAAAATELIHCASLVVDDLPCMDDAATRRGRPSLHREFGESTAVLASFAMVALAARCLMDPIVANGSAARLSRFQWTLLSILDAAALIKGQALDLASSAPSHSALITELKTVPLFELAVEAGGVSSPEYDLREAEFRRFARLFGVAFQTTDDYLDGDIEDVALPLSAIERARESAGGSHELMDLTDYLDARIIKDRRHR